MKIAGWIITIVGTLSLLGTIVGGHPSMGPLFWVGLGIWLLFRSYKKGEF